MSWEAYFALASTACALVAMAASIAPPDRVLGSVLAILVLAGVVSPERALSGFSNQGMATVALLFLVAAAVRRSGALSAIVETVLGRSGNAVAAQLRLMLPVASLSAFLNNTPVVAMFLPEVRRWGIERDVAPSQLLIPLSYAAIAGGMCTLIGTSTNLLVDGWMAERGHEHMGLFWISAVGLPAAGAALITVALLSRTLLPRRSARELPFADPRAFTAEFTVDPGGPLVGRRLADVIVPGLRSFAPIEIERHGAILAAPRRQEPLEANDRLVFAAPSAEIIAVHRLPGLTPAHAAPDPEAARGPSGVLVEAVVGHRCPLVGMAVGDGSFRRHYGAAVIAVAREGRRVPAQSLGGWVIEPGDALLLEADAEFVAAHRYGGELILVTDHGRATPHAAWHRPFSLVVVTAMVVAAAAGGLSMFHAALGAAVALVAGGVIRWKEAARDVEWSVLLAIVAALGIGAALEQTGAATAAAGWLVSLGGDSPWVTLALVYVATAVCTEAVTNNAAAVLMLPIALSAAAGLDASPLPFIAVVMIAASAAFITPIGYQTNLMVYGPGGYRFTDFARIGLPVSAVVGAVTVALAPRIWPF